MILLGFATSGSQDYKNPLFETWCNMIYRCYNKNRADYKHYGGRGVRVQEEFHEFELFFDYVSKLEHFDAKRDKKLSLDRIDVNRGYEIGNLRWVSQSFQCANKRNFRTDGGIPNIIWSKEHKKWRVRFLFMRKPYEVGLFSSINEALYKRNKYLNENSFLPQAKYYIDVYSA